MTTKIKTDVSLAERMATFLGWGDTNHRGSGILLWNSGDEYFNPRQLKDYFLDPSGNPPNPRGFQRVLDMLDEKFNFLDVSFFKFKGNIVCSIAIFNAKGKRIEPIIDEQTGPTRAHALYSAVDELMQEIEK